MLQTVLTAIIGLGALVGVLYWLVSVGGEKKMGCGTCSGSCAACNDEGGKKTGAPTLQE